MRTAEDELLQVYLARYADRNPKDAAAALLAEEPELVHAWAEDDLLTLLATWLDSLSGTRPPKRDRARKPATSLGVALGVATAGTTAGLNAAMLEEAKAAMERRSFEE